MKYFILMKQDLWTKQKVLGEAFQSCFQFVEISIPLVQYLEMVICNYHNMVSLGIRNGNTPSMKMKNFLCLFLNASKKTKKYYPFDFELRIEVNLKINCLEFEIAIYNKTDFDMPINFGLHPYFNVSDFKNLEFIDNPLNCQDQERNIISNTLDELNKINLGVDLLMYTSGRSSFRDKIFKREVTLNHPYPLDLGVIWSDPPRRMICLEPWTSPRNSFVDGFRNIMIPSNDRKRLNASIQIKSLK